MLCGEQQKKKVLDQIGLPPQEHFPRLLRFSTVEQHFYRKQYDACTGAAKHLLNASKTKNLDEKELLNRLAHPLLVLRQACCHPQVGGSGLKCDQNRILSMEEILDRLVDEERGKCEEAQRKCLMNYAALGAVAVIRAQSEDDKSPASLPGMQLWAEAAHFYQDALQLAKSNRSPGTVTGQVTLCSSAGLKSELKSNSSFLISWKLQDKCDISADTSNCARTGMEDSDRFWVSFEFSSSKRIQEITMTAQSASFEGYPASVQLLAMQNGVYCEAVRSTLQPFESQVIITNQRGWKSRFWKLCFAEIQSPQSPDSTLALQVDLKEPEISADPLQMLHLNENLLSVFDCMHKRHPDPGIKTQKESLMLDSKSIRETYILDRKDRHLHHSRNFRDFQKKVEVVETKLLEESFYLKKWKINSAWWEAILDQIKVLNSDRGAIEQDFIASIQGELSGAHSSGGNGTIPNFHNLFGLKMALKNRLNEMEVKSRTLSTKMAALSSDPSPQEINKNSNCGRCRKDWGRTGPQCQHCNLEKEIHDYSSFFFTYRQSKREVEDISIEMGVGDNAGATRAVRTDAYLEDSLLIKCLRFISRWAASRPRHLIGSSNTLIGMGNDAMDLVTFLSSLSTLGGIYFQIIEAKQQELKSMRKLWAAHHDILSIMDELSSAVEPLRLANTVEEYNALPEERQRSFLLEGELGIRREEYHLELTVAQSELEQAQKQLSYLRALLQQRDITAIKECPVCWDPLGDEVAVLACGHFLCVPCIEILLAKRGGLQQSFKCVKCRKISPTSLIHYATELNQKDGSESQSVKGSWGTKVSCLVADVLRLGIGEKCIIFSQWDEMLNIVEAALKENDIAYERLRGKKSFQKSLHNFRFSAAISCLLLPLKSGAQGLTLVEATHVFLLEPVFNEAIEQQAISRIHRIGQKNITSIHRYIVRETIEEKIEALKSKRTHHQCKDSKHKNSIAMTIQGKDDVMSMDDIKELFADVATVISEDS